MATSYKVSRSIVKKMSAMFFCAVAIAISASNAYAEDEFPQPNVWYQVTPSVVWCGDPDSTVTIEVHIVERRDVSAVQVTNPDDHHLIELFDDGTHGDPIAGDFVFSASEVLLNCNPRHPIYKTYNRWSGMLRVTLTDGRTLENNYGLSVGMVHPTYKGVYEVQSFGDGLSATAYAFFIEDTDHTVLNDYPVADLTCGKSNTAAFRKFYSVMPDDFDFVSLMPGMQILRPETHYENVPYDVLVSNHVQHIGVEEVDRTAEFGSSGRLKSMIYHSFGGLAIFDHEIAHTWGAGMDEAPGLLKEDYGNVSQGHWNEMSDIGGQLSAYFFSDDGLIGHFHDNGDGTWRLVPNTAVEPYAPLELYMMGLIPIEEVPPIHVLEDPDLSDPGRITASVTDTVTNDNLLAALGGERIPSVQDSQKAFNLAFLVTQDQPYTDAAYAFFSLMAQELMSHDPPREYSHLAPFYWATGGRATLNTRLPVDVSVPLNPFGTPTATLVPPTETPAPATATSSTTEVAQKPPTDEPTDISPTLEEAPVDAQSSRCVFASIGLVALPAMVVSVHGRFRRKKIDIR